MKILELLFGDPSQKKLAQYQSLVPKIRLREQEFSKSHPTLEDVQKQTLDWKSKAPSVDIQTPEGRKAISEYLQSILIDALALHCHACSLIYGKTFVLRDNREYFWNLRPYDVQIIGALALHEGNIAEMRTGEGKTFVASLAAYLNALSGLPVHIVTANDYLAARDANEMRCIYEALGLTVGVVGNRSPFDLKKEAYNQSIVYVTNNEIGFDYLRDNMAPSPNHQVAAKRYFAIVDEVDSILVDEARTPLIISAPDMEPTKKYLTFAELAHSLKNTLHYKIDEKAKTATLTEEGIAELERLLGIENIYLGDHYNDIHHIENALKAQTVYLKDRDYLIRNDEILIIDEHTGRVLAGRRYSDGLHQAIEAKERVTIQQESKTLASITFQNYFRLYPKLSGMTGTAKTEEEEFYKIYRLEVVTIPTNKPILRDDRSDLLFKNEMGKYAFAVKLIQALHEKGQPILVGTVSVVKSEYLSGLLTAANVRHEILNAKQDAREAEIIADAGKFGSVTIATNMAGRGTDIKLDEASRNLTGTVVLKDTIGNSYEFSLGGLFVLGMEKHETRRIDNQLRGRSGRQGDPGSSQFLVSPDDDIMRIFGGDKLSAIFNSPMFSSIPEYDPLIQSGTLTNRITAVQKQVEGRNFDMRKHILEYDDVLNQHRLVIYGRREKVLNNTNLFESTLGLIQDQISALVNGLDDGREGENYDAEMLQKILLPYQNPATNFTFDIQSLTTCLNDEDLAEQITEQMKAYLLALQKECGEVLFEEILRNISLRAYDENWMLHIDKMSHLKEEVAFEGFAQKQPLVVYKERAYDRFISLMQDISFQVTHALFSFVPGTHQVEDLRPETTQEDMLVLEHTNGVSDKLYEEIQGILEEEEKNDGIRVIQAEKKPSSQIYQAGRNEPCPCGSGKKFKHCHGKNSYEGNH